MPHCKADVLLEFAVGTPEHANMAEARRLLEDISRYGQVPHTDLCKSSCTLNAEQTQYMIDIDMWSLMTKEVVDEIMGVVKIFTLDETWKDPPRARIISWTWSVNHDMGLRIPFDLFKQCGVRHLVHDGPYAATIDGEKCFNQFRYSIDVGKYHAVYTPLGWCRLNRCAMGARPSCFIADTALRVLAQPCRSKWKTYIDNLLLVGEPEVIAEDLRVVKERSEKAVYTWNEDLSDPYLLIKEELEFLGAVLNFKEKTVRASQKVLNKLATVWSRRKVWTIHDFIVCVSVLVYVSNLVGRSMAPFQRVLQRWARAQSMTTKDPNLMKAGLAELPTEDILQSWVLITLENQTMPVPEHCDKHDFVLVTDACVDGWCGIIYSPKSGQSTVVRGEWPEGHEEYMKHSTTAEPMAVAASFTTFFKKGVRGIKVLHIGDNTPTVSEVNRGYSTCEGRFLAEFLQEHYPGITVNSKYYPGEAIPTDEGSRGLATRKEKLDVLIASLGMREVTSMTEIALESMAYNF